MKAINIFGILFLTITIFIFGYFVGRHQPVLVKAETNSTASETFSHQTQTLKWQVSDDKTLSVVKKKLMAKCEPDFILNSCEELSIFDDRGKKLSGLKDIGIVSYKLLNLTRQGAQLLIEINSGGTDNYFTILDYRNGKVVEIIDSTETQMRGGYWTMNEYRSGNQTPYFKPSQLFIINQLGGSDPNPYASIFRYRNGFYKKIGEISMQTLGDFIEKEISAK